MFGGQFRTLAPGLAAPLRVRTKGVLVVKQPLDVFCLAYSVISHDSKVFGVAISHGHAKLLYHSPSKTKLTLINSYISIHLYINIMNVYVYIHQYIYLYIHTSIYTFIHLYIYLYIDL